jgi:hypothetical protein
MERTILQGQGLTDELRIDITFNVYILTGTRHSSDVSFRCKCCIVFYSSLMARLNMLDHLSLETLSSQVLEFEGKARANPIGAPFRCFFLG